MGLSSYSARMKTITNALRNLLCARRLARQVLRYRGIFFRAVLSRRVVLAARLLAAESQLARCRERIEQTRLHSRARRASPPLRSRRCVAISNHLNHDSWRSPPIHKWNIPKCTPRMPSCPPSVVSPRRPVRAWTRFFGGTPPRSSPESPRVAPARVRSSSHPASIDEPSDATCTSPVASLLAARPRNA